MLCSNDDPRFTLTYLWQGQILQSGLFNRKKVKTVDFSEIIAASDLKFGRSRHLIKLMKVCEY